MIYDTLKIRDLSANQEGGQTILCNLYDLIAGENTSNHRGFSQAWI